MSDIVLSRDQGIPPTMKTRYTDMGDGTHALNTAVGQVGSVTLPADVTNAADGTGNGVNGAATDFLSYSAV